MHFWRQFHHSIWSLPASCPSKVRQRNAIHVPNRPLNKEMFAAFNRNDSKNGYFQRFEYIRIESRWQWRFSIVQRHQFNWLIQIFKYLKRFPSLGIQIELIKSISALISTYEIRLRSLPDCLDSEKTEILARNLFLTVWYWYRINGKPINLKTVEIDSKLTLFQRFIKKLIECDEIESNKEFVNIVSLFVNELSKSGSEEEKKLCLFLRRVCLAENFLLGVDVRSNKLHDIIYWDDVLSPFNLSEHEKSASFL